MLGAALLASSPASVDAARQTPQRYIVMYEGSVTDPTGSTVGRERRDGFRSYARFRQLKGFAAGLTERQVAALRRDPSVELITRDLPTRATGVPLAQGESVPTGVARMGAATATAVNGPSGANVAVLDTGIDLDHPDLDAAAGKNCITTGASPDDDHGHGTHVAGTIAARNTGAGVVGIVPGTRVFAVKVLDSRGSGYVSDSICGMDWVTATRTDSDPGNDIAVANMSLGGSGPTVGGCSSTTDAQHKAICRSTEAGVTYVVAAGNGSAAFDASGKPQTPAAYPQVLTVTAMADRDGKPGALGGSFCSNTDDRYAGFSNWADGSAAAAHTIAGPGVCIRSTARGGGYSTMSGTSMATPHVAGAVARCIDEGGTAGPCAGLTPAQIIIRMREDARARTRELAFGFSGDPESPVSGRFYGYLAPAAVSGSEPPPTEPPPTEPEPEPTLRALQPTAYTLTTGKVYSGRGAVSRLFENDSQRLEITAVRVGTSYVAEIRPTASITVAERDRLAGVKIDYDGGASRSSTAVTVRVFNFARDTWEVVDGPRSGSTRDRTATWSDTTAPKDYVSSAGEMRVSVHGQRSSGFRLRTDLVRYTVTLG